MTQIDILQVIQVDIWTWQVHERVFYGLVGLKNVQRITGIQTYSSTGNLEIDVVYGIGRKLDYAAGRIKFNRHNSYF